MPFSALGEILSVLNESANSPSATMAFARLLDAVTGCRGAVVAAFLRTVDVGGLDIADYAELISKDGLDTEGDVQPTPGGVLFTKSRPRIHVIILFISIFVVDSVGKRLDIVQSRHRRYTTHTSTSGRTVGRRHGAQHCSAYTSSVHSHSTLTTPPQIIPVRCFSCGKVIGNLWEDYLQLLANDLSEG
jgi:hypothetical protein